MGREGTGDGDMKGYIGKKREKNNQGVTFIRERKGKVKHEGR